MLTLIRFAVKFNISLPIQIRRIEEATKEQIKTKVVFLLNFNVR